MIPAWYDPLPLPQAGPVSLLENPAPMKYSVSMSAALAVLWLLLSGHYETLFLVLGALSVGFVVYLGNRMAVIDRESHPIHLTFSLIFVYWPWLLWQIVKSNLDVTWRILKPGKSISPTLVTVPVSQESDVGRVTHANSITLTPGTVSLEVHADYIEVHAISREGAEDVARGAIDRHVPDAEGPT